MLACFAFVSTPKASAVPSTMNFQGRLADATGTIVPDGLYNMQFRLFTASSGGSSVWNETRETTNRVQVTNGLFSTKLGEVNPISASLFASGNLYFEITLATPGTATCSTASCATWESAMTPRHQMGTSAYAFNSDTLDGLDSTAFAAASGSANYIQNTTSPQTADFNITGTGTAATLQAATLDRATSGALTIGGTNATSISLADNTTVNANLTVAAGNSLTLVGGNTASRPASPTEGMVYYDTDTKQLLTYSNGKWQADRSDAVLVAASNSSAADKAAADYIADGNTGAAADGDQVQINSALTAASGKKVVLLAGTYVVDASISVPNNTTLAGVGKGSLIEIADIDAAIDVIVNSDITTGTGITLRDFKMDGRNDLNTAGSQLGMYLNGMGSAASNRTGATISGVEFTRFRSGVISLQATQNSTISNNRLYSNANDALSMYSGSSYNKVLSNTFSDNLGGIAIGIYGDNNTVSNNTARGHIYGYGIEIGGDNNVVTGNVLSGNLSGFQIQGDNVTVTGNTVTASLSRGVGIIYSTRTVFSGNNVDGSAEEGIELFGTTNSTISGNTVSNNLLHGILIGGSSGFISTGVNIENNNVYNNGGSGASHSIFVETYVNDAKVTNNKISDTAGSGNAIRTGATAVNNTYLAGNVFSGTGATTINDLGTNTIFANQTKTAGGLDTVFKQASSTSAFQIQNASGTGFLTADSTNQQLVLRAASNTPTLGSDLFGSAVFDYAASTNWTGSGTGPTATATHAAGSSVGLVLTAGTNFAATVGVTYEIEYDITGYSAGYVTPYIGSNYGLSMRANGTNIKAVIRAYNTSGVRFYSDSSFVGTISNVTVKAYTDLPATLSIQDASGNSTVQLRTNSSTTDSVFLGFEAGKVNSGGYNTGFGAAAMQTNTTGSYNTAIGQIALQSNTTGSNNTVVGAQALQSSVTGNDNTAIGMWTLDGVTTGSGNVALGSFAGYGSGNSFNNIYIGLNSGTTDTGTWGDFYNAADLQNATAIGAYAISHQSNSIVLGSVNTATSVGIGTTKPDGLFSVSPTAYNTTGTAVRASQSGTTVTATGGTPFTTAMVGMKLIYGDGTSDTIQSFTSSTQVTVSTSRTVSSQHFRVHRGGFQVASSGDVSVKNTSTAAFQIQNSAGTSAFTVDTTNNNVTLGANTSLTLTGGTTAGRPTGAEGKVYYDTDTDKLLVYSNGKWQADRTDAVLVAASNSSQADKDAADFVADGDTVAAADGDQVQINDAITAGSGKKVVLLAGTYTIDATILLPNNTTLTGVGDSSLIQFADLDATDNMIENSDVVTGTAIVIRDLKLNGRQDLNTAGTQYGISLNNMGDGSGATAVMGAEVSGITITNVRTTALYVNSSNNNTFSGNNIYDIGGVGAAISLVASSNNAVTGNQLHDAGKGVYLSGASTNNTVTGNVAKGNSDSGFLAIGSTAVNNTFTGNVSDSNVANGFYIETSGNTVSGNTATNNDTGITMFSGSRNVITGNNVDTSVNNGIVLLYAAENIVSDNRIRSSGTEGIYISGSGGSVANNNTISDNRIEASGGATLNNGIYLAGADSDSNTIQDNTITDTSCTTNCYAINITTSGSDNTVLAGNAFSTTSGTATINDSGTGTKYVNQTKTANSLDVLYKQSASSTAFQIQNASSASLLTADSSSTNNRIQIGSNSTDATAIFFMLDRYNSGTDPTGTEGAMYYNTNTNKFRCYEAGAWANCITSTSGLALNDLSNITSTLINTSLIVDTTNTVDIGSSSKTWRAGYFGTSLSSPAIRPAADGTAAFKIQNAAGTIDYWTLDTTNNRILLGTSDTTGVLLVLDDKTGAGDPTGVNGGVYYNSNMGRLRCYENGAWTNCTAPFANSSTADQALTASATTYINGSMISLPANVALKAGTTFKWTVTMSKTAAGTVANTFDVRVGTNGTTADTSRLSFTMGTQTAAIDTAVVEITATVRSINATTGTMAGNYRMTHNLAATGFDNALITKTINATSANFDTTTQGLKIGLSQTVGASYAITVQQCQVVTTGL